MRSAIPARIVSFDIMFWAILGGALFVRIWGTKEYALNGDEMQFLIIAKGDTLAEVWRRGLAELHPPLTHFMRHYLLMLSEDIFVQRLFSVAAGMISILGITRLGFLVRGRFLALFCAFSMAFAPVAVSTSMVFRNYAFFMAFLSFALCFFVRYQQHGRRRELAWFTLLILLASASHFSGFLIAAACGIVEGWKLLRAKRWRQLMVFCLSFVPLVLLGGFFYLHYLAPGTAGPMWSQLTIATDSGPRDFHERLSNTGLTLISYFFPFASFLNTRWLIAQPYLAAAIFVGAFWMAALYIAALRKTRKEAPGLYTLTLVLWIISIGASLANLYPFSGGRHSYYLFAFYILPLGLLLEPYVARFALYCTPRSAALLIVIAALGLGGSGCYLFYEQEFSLKRTDLDDAQRYLTSHLKPADAIVTGRIDAYFYLLYAKDGGKTAYDPYADFTYAHQTAVLAPFDPPFKPFHSSGTFRVELQRRADAHIVPSQGDFWFVMYGWDNIEIRLLLECGNVQKHDLFSRDGVIIFAITAGELAAFLKDDTAWQHCYADYKPLLTSNVFGRYWKPGN